MIIAAHQTMLAPQSAPLPPGSVLFARTDLTKPGLLVNSLFSSIPTTWTITAWAKTATTPTYGGIFKLGWNGETSGGGGVGFGFGNTNFTSAAPGTNAIVLTEGAAWTSYGSAGTITQWKHYAITKSGSSISVYINGSLLSTKSLSSTSTGACPFTIGGGHALAEISSRSASRLFDGNITRVAVWTSELSSSQVQTDYADRGSSPSQTTNLAHFWPLSDPDKYLLDAIGGATLTSSVNAAFSTDTPFA